MRDISIFYLESVIEKNRFRFVMDTNLFLATVHMYIYNFKIFLGKIFIPSLFRKFLYYMAESKMLNYVSIWHSTSTVR